MKRSYAKTEDDATEKRTGPRGGRPPKYAEPRRPVTVTLPERILKRLHAIDPDRSRAIVRSVEAEEARSGRADPVELIELTRGKALIVVRPCPALDRIPWLRRVEIAPSRYLLALPPGTAVEVLEVALTDRLAEAGKVSEADRRLLRSLLAIIRSRRRGRQLSAAEILLVDLPARRRAGLTPE